MVQDFLPPSKFFRVSHSHLQTLGQRAAIVLIQSTGIFSVGIHADLNPRSISTDESSSPAEKGKDGHINTFVPSILLAELGFSVFSHFYTPLVAGKTCS